MGKILQKNINDYLFNGCNPHITPSYHALITCKNNCSKTIANALPRVSAIDQSETSFS